MNDVLERLASVVDDDELWTEPAEQVGSELRAALAAVNDRGEGIDLWRRLLERYQRESEMHGDYATSTWARDVLVAAGSVVLDTLIGALDDPDSSIRAVAVRALAAHDGGGGEYDTRDAALDGWVARARDRASRRIVALVSDADALVRTHALHATATLLRAGRDADATAAVVGATRDGDPRVRAAAVHALRSVDGVSVETTVAARLSDEDLDVRRAALWYFDRWPAAASRHLTALIEQLEDPDATITSIAVRVVGNRAAVEAREPLLSALARARTDAQRLDIAFALAAIADDRVVPALKSVVEARGAASVMAALILGQLRATDATLEIAALLETDTYRVGNHAVFEALAMMGDLRAAPGLRAFIARSLAVKPWRDEPGASTVEGIEHDRRCAVEALGILDDRESRELVRDCLVRGDAYMRRNAALALGTLGERADLPRLAACIEAQRDYPTHLPARARLATVMLAPEGVAAHVDPLLDTFARIHATRAFGAAFAELARRLATDELLLRARGHAWHRLASGVVAMLARTNREAERPTMSFAVPEARFERDLFVAIGRTWSAIRDDLAS